MIISEAHEDGTAFEGVDFSTHESSLADATDFTLSLHTVDGEAQYDGYERIFVSVLEGVRHYFPCSAGGRELLQFCQVRDSAGNLLMVAPLQPKILVEEGCTPCITISLEPSIG